LDFFCDAAASTGRCHQLALRQRGLRHHARGFPARLIVSQRLIHVLDRAILIDAVKAQGASMGLLLAFIVCLIIGQSLTIGLGLLVERYSTPYTGLVTFIASYFAMFWLAWLLAVRITKPRSRLAAE
jgi:hypothetical protein